jgi:hypothetical protein
MRTILKVLIFLFSIIVVFPVWGYDVLFDADDPTDMGDVPAIHDGNGGLSTSTRWKSSQVQATMSGTVTHFIVRIGNPPGIVPIGFAVYADVGNDPADMPLIRGYYASYDFSSSGYYAIPFVNSATLDVTAGTYYHIVYLLTPGNPEAASGHRVTDTPHPIKWASDCKAAACSEDSPPGVNGETWNFEYDPDSGGWACGLLITQGNGSSISIPSNVKIW